MSSTIRTLEGSNVTVTSRRTSKILNLSPDGTSSRDSEERVTLHYAAQTADAERFKHILELDNSLIDCQDRNGYTPLLIATMTGNTSVMKQLIENGAQINHLDKDKHSAVHWAVVCGQLEALIMLLDNGAKVDFADNQGAQAIHYVTATEGISRERSEAILHVLLKHDAKANARDVDGRSPILWAASNGNLEAIISIAQAGGDMYVVDRDRLNIIHCAASHGHIHIIEYAVNCLDSTILNSVDRNGDTPLFYAVTLGHNDCARLLLLNGADANHQDYYLRCPSHCAAAKGQLRILKLLKNFGASCEIQNGRGDLPIHEAIQAGAKDCVEYLLALHPSTIDAANHSGRTGLHLAAASGNMEMVTLLCTRNALINPLMLYKDTLLSPLDLAKRKNHDLIFEYLRLRQEAKLAEELPEEARKLAKSYFENHPSENTKNSYVTYENGLTAVQEQKKQKFGFLADPSQILNSTRKLSISNNDVAVKAANASQETQTTITSYRVVATNTSKSTNDDDKITKVIQTTLSLEQSHYLPKATSTTDLERYIPSNQKIGRISKSLENSSGEVVIIENNGREDNNSTVSEDNDNENYNINNNKRSENIPRPSMYSSFDQKYKKEEVATENGKNFSGSNESDSDNDNDDYEQHYCKNHYNLQSKASTRTKNVNPQSGSVKRSGKNKLKDNDRDNLEAKLKESVGLQNIDIYKCKPSGSTMQLQKNNQYKKIGVCYAHEKVIFNELTHLKKMQLQYGKVKESVLVRSLTNNFCRMHNLNATHFNFQTFHAWEKFLHDHLSDQLKLLYEEERNRIMNKQKVPHPSVIKFRNHLDRAQAVPLNVRLTDLAHAYRTNLLPSTITEDSSSAKSDTCQCGAEKRCNCLNNKRDLM